MNLRSENALLPTIVLYTKKKKFPIYFYEKQKKQKKVGFFCAEKRKTSLHIVAGTRDKQMVGAVRTLRKGEGEHGCKIGKGYVIVYIKIRKTGK